MAKTYIALFEQGEHGGYSVVFPDVPGVVTAGDNYDEAYRMAHEALAFHIDGLRLDGEEAPEPRSLEDIKASWEDWPEWEAEGDFMVVPIALLPLQAKSIRVDVMLPERLVARIDAASRNRSAFLAAVAEQYFAELSRKKA
jgi:predicted RNase H-like HicB family nuclease